MANQNPQQGQEKQGQGQKGQQAGQQNQEPAKKPGVDVTEPDGTAGRTPDPNQDKGQQSKP